MFRDPPLTKRQVGWLFVIAGAGLALALMVLAEALLRVPDAATAEERTR